MQIASKHEVQRKEYPICQGMSTQIWTIQRIFQLDSRYKPAGMTGEEYGSNESGVCLSPLEAVLKLIPDVMHVRRFVMLSVAEASFPPNLVRDSSTSLRSAQNDRVVAHSREGAK